MKKTVALVLLLGVSGWLGAATFYVSPQGNDAASGDINNPWKNISHGLQNLSSGDHLVLRGGVYRLIEDDQFSTINTPHLTLEGFAGETVEILGSYTTSNHTWEPYNANVWRIPADAMSRDPKGMFNGHTRVHHQSDLDGGRDHDHVYNLTTPNHWTKADVQGNQCFESNVGCYIYLYPATGEDPNQTTYELSQRGLPRVAGNGDYFTLRNLHIYYTQSSPMFFEGADFVTLENNTFAHVSNGNDNAYAVRIWDSQGSVVRGNTVFDSVYWGGTSNSKGISFMVTKPGEPNVVEYNEIYDIPGRSAVGTKGGTSNLIVRYNYIHHVYNAFEPGSARCVWSATNTDGCQSTDIEYRAAGDWEIYGNIITHSDIGLILSAYDEDNDNNRIYNNVFYQNQSAVEIGWDGTFGTELANNIFMANEVGIYLHSGGTTTTVDDYLDQFTSQHNLYFDNSHADIHLRPNWGGNFYSGTPYDLTNFKAQFANSEQNSLSANPQVANTIEFQLLETSPAIGAGNADFWPEPTVNIGAHPIGFLTDLLFEDGFD